jgi:hypothetical protein
MEPDLVEVFAKALRAAEASGVSEIGIDQLLEALDSRGPAGDGPPGRSEEPFRPVPKREMVFSAGAREVLASIELQRDRAMDSLRNALLEAKNRGLK